jgi:hypothetical protein
MCLTANPWAGTKEQKKKEKLIYLWTNLSENICLCVESLECRMTRLKELYQWRVGRHQGNWNAHSERAKEEVVGYTPINNGSLSFSKWWFKCPWCCTEGVNRKAHCKFGAGNVLPNRPTWSEECFYIIWCRQINPIRKVSIPPTLHI